MIHRSTAGSAPQKTVLVILESLLLGVALWLLNFGGFQTISRLLNRD